MGRPALLPCAIAMLWSLLLLVLAARWHSVPPLHTTAARQRPSVRHPLVGRLLLLQPVWRSKFSVALCHYYRTTVEVRYTKPSPRGWRLSDTSGVLSLPSSDTSPMTERRWRNARWQRLVLGIFFFLQQKIAACQSKSF